MPKINLLRYIKAFYKSGHERTIRAKKNISVSFLCKTLSLIISFLIVPLTLSYVSKLEYGIWMAISSIINWFVFFDIGLGNGLRNKLAEALAINDKKTAKIYISSSFAIITGIAIILFLGFLITANFISWNKVLNTDLISNYDLFLIVIVVFFFFCINFVFSLVSSILQAMQKYALNDILGLSAQILGLIALYILVNTTDGSLFYLCLVYSSKTAVVMVFAAIILFMNSLKFYRPTIKDIQLKKAIPLISLGFKFFISQILYLVFTQSPVILVIQFFGPEEVTVFNLAVKYITITSMGYMMVLTPFLSAFTEAFIKGEFSWIKSIVKKIRIIWVMVSIFTILMIFVYKGFFHYWVGDNISVPLSLVIGLSVSSIISTWDGTYGLFLNGIGKIHLQIYIVVIQAFIFVPLSYIFYKLNFGLVSIVMAQIVLYTFSSIIKTVQYNKIINLSANGIWIK